MPSSHRQQWFHPFSECLHFFSGRPVFGSFHNLLQQQETTTNRCWTQVPRFGLTLSGLFRLLAHLLKGHPGASQQQFTPTFIRRQNAPIHGWIEACFKTEKRCQANEDGRQPSRGWSLKGRNVGTMFRTSQSTFLRLHLAAEGVLLWASCTTMVTSRARFRARTGASSSLVPSPQWGFASQGTSAAPEEEAADLLVFALFMGQIQ